MATIHEFRPSTRTDRSNRQGGAEIIIFPGVRYERRAEPLAAKPKRRRKTRVKRDHLRIKA